MRWLIGSWLMVLAIVGLCLLVMCDVSLSQFADITTDARAVNIGVSGDRGSQTHTATVVVPVGKISGWIGLHGLQSIGDGDVLSEILKARVQGGGSFSGIGIEGFLDAESNYQSGKALQSQFGYFLRPGIYEQGGLRISGGLGNYLENVQVREELGLEEDDPTSVRWIGFVSINWFGLATIIRLTPDVIFDDFQFSLDPSIDLKVGEKASLGIQGRLSYESDPLTEPWQAHYALVLRLIL